MDANVTSGSDTKRLAGVMGWLIAVSLFAAGVITTLLEFDITASPPRETPPNDLVEGTLAFFQNESDRWPQQLTAGILFTIGFLALIGLVVLLRRVVSRDDPRMMLGTLAVGTGAGIGAASQLLFIGAKEVGIDPHYCDCARAAEQIISRGQTLGMIENAQTWLVVGFLGLAGAGLFFIWRATASRGIFSPAWRGVTLVLAILLLAGVIVGVSDLEDLQGAFVALAGAIVTPIWALMTARQFPATGEPAA